MIITNESDAIKVIIANDKPCIFVDTCVLLDIIRIPFRENLVNNYFDMDRLSRDNIANIVMSEINLNEYAQNTQNVKLELERHIVKVKNHMMKIEAVSNFVGIGFDLLYKEIDTYKLPDAISKKIDELIQRAIVIKVNPESELDGSRRASRKIAPSKSGQINDSIFYSSFLRTWEKLRGMAYVGKIAFATSNTSDFGKTDHPFYPINDEIRSNTITYVNSLSWAMHEIAK